MVVIRTVKTRFSNNNNNNNNNNNDNNNNNNNNKTLLSTEFKKVNTYLHYSCADNTLVRYFGV